MYNAVSVIYRLSNASLHAILSSLIQGAIAEASD